MNMYRTSDIKLASFIMAKKGRESLAKWELISQAPKRLAYEFNISQEESVALRTAFTSQVQEEPGRQVDAKKLFECFEELKSYKYI